MFPEGAPETTRGSPSHRPPHSPAASEGACAPHFSCADRPLDRAAGSWRRGGRRGDEKEEREEAMELTRDEVGRPEKARKGLSRLLVNDKHGMCHSLYISAFNHFDKTSPT